MSVDVHTNAHKSRKLASQTTFVDLLEFMAIFAPQIIMGLINTKTNYGCVSDKDSAADLHNWH